MPALGGRERAGQRTPAGEPVRGSEGESPRARRRRVVRELRAAGRDGPGLREVLPGLAVLVVLVCGATAGLAAAGRAVGVWVPGVALAAVAVAGVVVRRRTRRPTRRRRGYYSAEELAELDMPGLVLAVARMLRRDGWRVTPPRVHSVPHLAARDGRGRLLDVAFRPVAEPLPDEEAACSCRSRARSGPRTRLVVHRGSFTHRDEVWAARQGRTHLIDGARLRLWARGTPLAEIAAVGRPAPRRL
ncbi:hypothetical protein ACIHAR_33865 [Streptomyces sp. NPDC052016]|uniref:hypothetical protein n=1 Tax=Streptomyces sp. NPDC052016 TaxID=3365680 RepID=UPI0037CD7F32